jgi:EAL domain-containing protein (putative c-di-GMP-specific phosphodiesterase class I)
VNAAGRWRWRAYRNDVGLPGFTMAFQPIVDIETGATYAQEALVRPSGGGSAADILGQIGTRSLHAFDQQCRVKAITLAASLDMRSFLHINFLPNAVYQPEDSVHETLYTAERAGFALDNLVFEVTER